MKGMKKTADVPEKDDVIDPLQTYQDLTMFFSTVPHIHAINEVHRVISLWRKILRSDA